MGNAPDAVKAAGRLGVTATNDEEGIVHALSGCVA